VAQANSQRSLGLSFVITMILPLLGVLARHNHWKTM